MSNSYSIDFLRISTDELINSVGKIEYKHSNKNQSGTAYPSSEGVSLLLYIPREISSTKASIIFYNESSSAIVLEKNAELIDTKDNFDIYSLKIKGNTLPRGLYFFIIKLEGLYTLYGYKCGNNIIFKENGEADKFQLTIFEPQYKIPSHKFGGIIYHLFVDRFNRGGSVPTRNDAVMVEDWDSEIPEYPAYPGAFLKNNYFYGGTLYGVIDKLDYLVSLGVNTIYLSPIFEAYSNHKYDTGDYSRVDDMFGGDEAFKKLIKEARKKGIGIILDGVYNHTGADSIYFNKNNRYKSIGAYQSVDSPYYEWYDFKSHPNDYTSWWGIEILPRINPDKEKCREFFIGKNGVIRKYSKLGIDGLRLDVADELSDSFIAGIKEALNENNSTSILYGEVWEDASNKIAYDKRKKYYLGDELDGVMNYPIRTGIIDYITKKNKDALAYAINEVLFNMPKCVRDATMNLLGTHDTERILTKISGVESNGANNDILCKKRLNKREYSLAVNRLKSAYTILATLPGIPSIYYGDEAGIEGYSDPFNRRPYPWGKENKDLLAHYKNIGKIRRQNSVYKEGELNLIKLDNDMLIFERIDDNDRFITIYNNSSTSKIITFDNKVTNLLSESKGKSFVLEKESALVLLSKDNNSFQII